MAGAMSGAGLPPRRGPLHRRTDPRPRARGLALGGRPGKPTPAVAFAMIVRVALLLVPLSLAELASCPRGEPHAHARFTQASTSREGVGGVTLRFVNGTPPDLWLDTTYGVALQ